MLNETSNWVSNLNIFIVPMFLFKAKMQRLLADQLSLLFYCVDYDIIALPISFLKLNWSLDCSQNPACDDSNSITKSISFLHHVSCNK